MKRVIFCFSLRILPRRSGRLIGRNHKSKCNLDSLKKKILVLFYCAPGASGTVLMHVWRVLLVRTVEQAVLRIFFKP